MKVDAIQNGIVIDHITAGLAFRLYNLLELDKLDCPVAIIKNVNSAKMGKKDIIKIDSEHPIDFNVVGFVDPKATINVIKDGVLKEKLSIDMPLKLKNVIKCKNPRCITSVEQEIEHVFLLTDKEEKVYRCLYCETKADI
ncbi:MAG: aspartate carbamoyltransferase regulatory subunit [Ruminococcus sp.]|nr:aspartate carbamoyltransferase regulatory subunit [Ruminococcus sp.]